MRRRKVLYRNNRYLRKCPSAAEYIGNVFVLGLATLVGEVVDLQAANALDVLLNPFLDETENNEYKGITLKIFEAVENFGLWILHKIHLNFLADFYNKYIEVMRYLICGALSTIVNIVAYIIGSKVIFAI